MNWQLRMRDLAARIPPELGRPLAHVPYELRLGPEYLLTQRLMRRFARYSLDKKKAWILQHARAALDHAFANNPFYAACCRAHNFDPRGLERFDDLARVPLLMKHQLQAVAIEERSAEEHGRILTNTGGSTGKPLAFYLDRRAFAREWAHMHHIWRMAGYRTSDLKLTFRGKNLGRDALRYNAVYNEYYVNVYLPAEVTAAAVKGIGRHVRAIHGYPSAIYEFIRHCAAHDRATLDSLRRGLRCVLLASEYPAPQYRDVIEAELGVPTISWYGHSEMAVLAHEVEPYVYAPMHTYGFAEAVPDDAGRFHLVGTSYWNTVSPFLRYDTEDCIVPEFEDGLLTRFRIETGRQGEFIEDLQGNRISLTALVFGRHHRLFGRAAFIQVRAGKPGKATILVTLPEQAQADLETLRAEFDALDVAVEFDFEVLREPVRTPGGKVPLLAPPEVSAP